MIAFRICNTKYQDDISGTGAKLYGGRWNSPGIPMLYLAGSVSLAMLEMLVHLQFADKSTDFALLDIQAPSYDQLQKLQADKLKQDWQEDVDYTRFIGDEFIKQGQQLILQVPSAIVEEEYNYLINPLHRLFDKVTVENTRIIRFDERLFTLK